MDEEKILSGVADRNVTQLDTVEKALRGMLPAQRTMQRQRQQIGARADGGMAPAHTYSTQDMLQQVLQNEKDLQNALADARRLVDNFEDEQIRREDEILQLKATLEEERSRCMQLEGRCEELKNILRSAAEIMVNGEKKA